MSNAFETVELFAKVKKYSTFCNEWYTMTAGEILAVNMCRGERGARRFPRLGCLVTVIKPIMGLVIDVTPFHCLCTLCKWQPPGTAISFHLVMRGAHCTSWLTFQLTVGWDTSCTTTLPVGTAKHLIHINKRISLVTLSFILQPRLPPKRVQHQPSENT